MSRLLSLNNARRKLLSHLKPSSASSQVHFLTTKASYEIRVAPSLHVGDLVGSKWISASYGSRLNMSSSADTQQNHKTGSPMHVDLEGLSNWIRHQVKVPRGALDFCWMEHPVYFCIISSFIFICTVHNASL